MTQAVKIEDFKIGDRVERVSTQGTIPVGTLGTVILEASGFVLPRVKFDNGVEWGCALSSIRKVPVPVTPKFKVGDTVVHSYLDFKTPLKVRNVVVNVHYELDKGFKYTEGELELAPEVWVVGKTYRRTAFSSPSTFTVTAVDPEGNALLRFGDNSFGSSGADQRSGSTEVTE